MRGFLMVQRISKELVERARRLYAERGTILPPQQVEKSLRNLGKVFAELNRGGHLLTNGAGTPVFCRCCGVPIFSTERYEANRSETENPSHLG